MSSRYRNRYHGNEWRFIKDVILTSGALDSNSRLKSKRQTIVDPGDEVRYWLITRLICKLLFQVS